MGLSVLFDPWLFGDPLLDDPIEDNGVGLEDREGKDVGALDEPQGVAEGGSSVEVGSVGFWELASFALSLHDADDVAHHSLLVAGFNACQVVDIVVLGGDGVVSAKVFVDPDFGVALVIEADHLIGDFDWPELVVQFRVSLQRVVEYDVGLLEGELSGICQNGGDSFC